MSTLNVWLIRHGQSTANIAIWGAHPDDIILTAKGREQANNAAIKITERPDLLIVSPYRRAQESALPIKQHWHDVAIENWPIQEFSYLSPSFYQHKTTLERRAAIENYWHRADPYFCDGNDAESFNDFIKRLVNFQQRLITKNGFVVAVGHGQFFKAFLLGLERSFEASSEWMKVFRHKETSEPIANGEIIQLKRIENQLKIIC